MSYLPDMLPERIAVRIAVDEASGCWRWNGAHSHGYAVTWRPTAEHRNNAYAHRVTYHLLVDPTLPMTGAGRFDQIDHVAELCAHRPDCVNPAHLQRVNCRTNNARARMLEGYTSRFIGVSRADRRWRVQMSVKGRNQHIGTFDSEAAAARAYDAACVALGEPPLNETHGLFRGVA